MGIPIENYSPGELFDEFNKESLSKSMRFIKTCVEFLPQVNFYLACKNEELFTKIFTYIREEFKIENSNIFKININMGNIHDIRSYMPEIMEKIKQSNSNKFIILINNFEKVIRDTKERDEKNYDINLTRRAHDFDQNILGGEYKEELEKINKKIIMLNRIGYQEGEEIYNDSIISACGSHFKKKIIIIND